MSRSIGYWQSKIGRKQFVGLTGLGLSLFVLTHMLGNLLIFCGPESYNMYGHKLVSNPLIYVAEAGLLGAFIIHLGLALKLSLENHSARPEAYAVSSSGEKGTSLVQKTMWHQGVIILVFVVLHLLTFKFGDYYEYTSVETGEVIRDLYTLIINVFQSPIYTFGYILALVVLGMHLSHGVSSAIQSLGFHHPRFQCKVELIGKVYAAIVALGFISQPIYVFFFHK